MCSDRSTALKGQWVSQFGYPRIKAWSAAPRGFSQPPTSFIGFRRQGIHRWLFVAWRTKMLVLAMEFSRGKMRDRKKGRARRAAGNCRHHLNGSPSRGPAAAAPLENGTED